MIQALALNSKSQDDDNTEGGSDWGDDGDDDGDGDDGDPTLCVDDDGADDC